jgi:hypothetical protein
MTGEPLGGVIILAKASPPSSDMTCQAREVKTSPAGTYKFKNLCSGQQYLISTTTPNLFLAGSTGAMGGEEQLEPTRNQAWRAPTGTGVYRMADDALAAIPSFSDVATAKTRDGEVVRYPTLKPTGRVITIEEGQHLLLAGRKNIKRLTFYPLVQDSGRRNFTDGAIIDHVYIGASWESGTLERKEAVLDAEKTKDVLVGTKGLRYLSYDAFPAGRYALLGESDERVMIIDFGTSQAPSQ